MKKSTIAAIAAASVMGFGMAGNALAADVEVSGFADIRYHAVMDDDALNSLALVGGEAGNFSANGEVDFRVEQEGAKVNIDLNLFNILDPDGGTETDLGTAAVDVEQLNVELAVPNMDMLTLTAGIYNSPFGMEGQDATDINFAQNGILWVAVPSQMGGANLNAELSEQLSLNVGYINARTDISGVGNRANDYYAVANFAVNDNIGVTVGYITDTTEALGDQIDAYVTASDLVPGLELAVEYLSGDPATGSGLFDNGYGLHASFALSDTLGVAGRYEMASDEAGIDYTNASVAVNLAMSDDCVVRADVSEYVQDAATITSGQQVTIQMVHSF